MEKLGKAAADGVDWSALRLICIAGDFNRYDNHAVNQMQRNIELIRYRRFGPKMLMLDLVTARTTKGVVVDSKGTLVDGGVGGTNKYKTIGTVLQELDVGMIDRFEALPASMIALGDDVKKTTLRFYIAFKRIK